MTGLEWLMFAGGLIGGVIAMASAFSARLSATAAGQQAKAAEEQANAASRQLRYAAEQAAAAKTQAAAAQGQLHHQELANVISQFAFWKHRLDQTTSAEISLKEASSTLQQISELVEILEGARRPAEIAQDLIENNLLTIPVRDCSPDQIVARASHEIAHIKMTAEQPIARAGNVDQIHRIDGIIRSSFAKLDTLRSELPAAIIIQSSESEQARAMLQLLEAQLGTVPVPELVER